LASAGVLSTDWSRSLGQEQRENYENQWWQQPGEHNVFCVKKNFFLLIFLKPSERPMKRITCNKWRSHNSLLGMTQIANLLLCCLFHWARETLIKR
jgi:hypothetical protein